MGVTILEVINAGGYDLETEEGARWLLQQTDQFEQLIVKAEDLVEKIESAENDRLEREYNERWRDE